jgi:hypothetical protein
MIFATLALCEEKPSSPGNEHPTKRFGLSIKYSIGNIYFLPSLRLNSNLKYDDNKRYTDITIDWRTKISDNITYSALIEVTDQPHQLIGTKYSRPDFPLSTGRVQVSRIDFVNKSLLISVGRGDYFTKNRDPTFFSPPVTGDGLAVEYRSQKLSFKYVIESLPAEEIGGKVFHRLLSYHHLEYKFGCVALGVGEYFILTGNTIGLELKRLNPFLPFSLNSHDSESNYYQGYSADSDNSIIKLYFDWITRKSKLYIQLYIDEFQMDNWDRKLYSDAILFNIKGKNVFESIIFLNKPGVIEANFSISHPNFGDHAGPFTSTNSGGFPLFEYAPGMLRIAYFRALIELSPKDILVFSIHHERWIKIWDIEPERRYLISALNSLEVQADARLMIGYERELVRLKSLFEVQGWISSGTTDLGFQINIHKEFPF